MSRKTLIASVAGIAAAVLIAAGGYLANANADAEYERLAEIDRGLDEFHRMAGGDRTRSLAGSRPEPSTEAYGLAATVGILSGLGVALSVRRPQATASPAPS